MTGDKRWTVDGGTGRSDATLTWGDGSGHISIDWSSEDPCWWSEIYNDDRAALAALVADVQVAARVRRLASLFEAGRASDELRRTVAGLLAPFLDYNASPIVAADAALAASGISDALARDAKVAEIVAESCVEDDAYDDVPVSYRFADCFDAVAALYPEAGK